MTGNAAIELVLSSAEYYRMPTLNITLTPNKLLPKGVWYEVDAMLGKVGSQRFCVRIYHDRMLRCEWIWTPARYARMLYNTYSMPEKLPGGVMMRLCKLMIEKQPIGTLLLQQARVARAIINKTSKLQHNYGSW